MSIIGVIGAGVMGIGVAQRFAQKGHDVVLIDISEEILEVAKSNLEKNIRFYKMFAKNDTSVNEDIIGKIKFTTNYDLLKDVDYVIENVPEVFETKKEVYKLLESVCKKDCIYMVNTSCISITKIGGLTNRADKVIGTHFMNPVPVKKATEVIKGYHTSEETVAAVEALLETVGKRAIVVNDYPGFVSNRISHLLMNEAAYTLQDSVATVEDIDDIFKSCFEHKMGPLETADLIGLDTVVSSLNILYESYQDPKYRCCPLLRKMVDAGHLGRKTGKGFYEYF